MNLQSSEHRSALPAVTAGIPHAARLRRKPSMSTLAALLSVKQYSDLDGLIERLQKETCEGYAKFGVGAEQYEQPFDDLHCCRMVRMALYFRAVRGLPPDARTPYDDADLEGWLAEARNAAQSPTGVLA